MGQKTSVTKEEVLAERKAVVFAGIVKRLGLAKRVPELIAKRGWPNDPELAAAITAAIVSYRVGAHAQPIKRPATADMLGGLWPRNEFPFAYAKEVVDSLELDDFVRPMS